MEKLAKLFEPGMIGKLKLKNRIILSPMLLGYGQDFYPTDEYTAFLQTVAKGGVGLIITGAARVVEEFGVLSGSIGIFDDKFIPSLREMVRKVKSCDSRIFMQVNHAGTRGSEHAASFIPVAPSAIAHPLTGVVPKELSKQEIEHLIQAFTEAARRIKDANFDGIEIHGAHGYLVNQFLSPRTNKRTDKYGGSLVNRARFACDIIERIREEVGSDFPMSFRICGDEYVEGGVRINDAVTYAQLFVEAGVDALHVSAGCGEAHHRSIPNFMHEPGCLTHLASAIKKVVKVPVIAVGKLGDPVVAERVLREGKADFIAMGRPLLADHELPNKAREGRLADIRPCIYCNLGCSHIKLDGKVTCTVNPSCGLEMEYRLKPAVSQKRITVVGGGLAGMEAARTLADRGHKVSLYEKSDKLGGQWNIVSRYQAGVAVLTEYLSRGLEKAGVKVIFDTEVNTQIIKEIKPDAVVLAMGAKQIVPEIPGVEGKNVVLASDVLLGNVNVGEEVVIIGGGLVGCDTALFLAKQRKKISVLDIVNIAANAGRTFKLTLMEGFVKHRVFMYPNSHVYSITETGVNIVYNGELLFLKADSVVIAVGSRPEDKLAKQIKRFVSEIHMIGDCVEPRNSLAAIHEGAKVGNEL
jgi:2,4-dienoyl-CoA reductase-like NADH-dependent reductase (Old Yellow Enzyme family)/thioredoxin reductase